MFALMASKNKKPEPANIPTRVFSGFFKTPTETAGIH